MFFNSLFSLLQPSLKISFIFSVFSVFMYFSAGAEPETFHFDFESDFYRETVTPSIFPVFTFGYHSRLSNEINTPTEEEEFVADADFRISPTHPKADILAIKNFYYGDQDQRSSSPLRFSFGRRLIGWSSLDQMWGLGQFEPLNGWDKLRPDTMGLTGIFAYTETKRLNFRFFFSYLSLPELGPNVVIENNQFVSEDPQSIASIPQTYTLLNRPTPLGYNISLPPLNTILFRPSIAFMLETKKEFPFHYHFSYGYLPQNYFPIAMEASLSIPLDQIIVNLHPRILSHQIYDNEFAYHFSDHLSLGTNVVVDVPTEETIPSDYTTTPLSTSVSYSPWIQYKGNGFELTASQLWTRGGLEADVGPYANSSNSIFSSHLFYRNASQLAFNYEFNKDSTHPFSLISKYIHEYSIDGDWIAADLFYHLQKNLTLYFGGDLIGAEQSASPDRGAEFLSDLRTLDRIRGGFHYVY